MICANKFFKRLFKSNENDLYIVYQNEFDISR